MATSFLPPLRRKRGQSMSINTIIIVVLALVVLTISILIFNKYIKSGDKSLSDTCRGTGGSCANTFAQGCGEKGIHAGVCKDASKICCEP